MLLALTNMICKIIIIIIIIICKIIIKICIIIIIIIIALLNISILPAILRPLDSAVRCGRPTQPIYVPLSHGNISFIH